jgi:hypothetical protein
MKRLFFAFIGMLVLMIALLWGGWSWGMRIQWNPHQTAQAMQARWEQQDITAYRLVVDVQEPYFSDGLYVLTVEDGVVTDAQAYNSLTYRFDPNAEPYPVTSSLVEQYTMERLHQYALNLLEGKWGGTVYRPTTSHVLYDEQSGQLEQLVDNTCGWLFQQAEACLTRYTVLELTPLTR